MTSQSKYFRPNRDDVVSKLIDGEAIVINLSNGVYYSMDGVAGTVWGLIDREMSIDEILSEVTQQYGVARSQAETDLSTLIAQLVEENLVVESSGRGESANSVTSAHSERLAYQTPTLNIYRDMGDLLALDPPQPGLENTPWKAASDGLIDETER